MSEPIHNRAALGKIAALIFLLFSVPFTVIGVQAGATALGPAIESVRMRRWVEVPAQVLSATLDVHELNRGGPLYRARARYRYTVAGTTYEGTRVSLIEAADSVGSYHLTTHARLRAAFDTGQPVPCFVNPDNPSESILVRQIRWDGTVFLLLFAVSFAGPGLLLGIVAALSLAGRPVSLGPLERLGRAMLPGGGRKPDAS